jgi:hypothetical protein
MIYWRIQDLYDADICEQGRVDCEAYMAKTGIKPTDWITAVEGLFGGVAGTVWGMGFPKKGSVAEARDALSRFIVRTAQRATKDCSEAVFAIVVKLDQLLRGHKFNLAVTKARLRKDSCDELLRPRERALALLLYVALDETVPLNVRAVRVSEQAMLAATYHEGHAVPSTEAYKAEYQRQYDDLKAILEGAKSWA